MSRVAVSGVLPGCAARATVGRMECRVGDVAVHYAEHGAGGVPVLVLHGAGVDHREPEACFEPALRAVGGLRRLYPDLPGAGRTPAPARIASADDVREVLVGLIDALVGPGPVLLVGHSAGAYYAQGVAARRPGQVAGLAMVCPLLAGVRDVPEHRPVVRDDELGDDEFRGYFVVQTPAMLERYEQVVAPGAALADAAAAQRIGARWELTAPGPPYGGPTLVVAGRQDSTVGFAGALDLLGTPSRTSVAVLDGAGHALPHEQPAALGALLRAWVSACLDRPPAD